MVKVLEPMRITLVILIALAQTAGTWLCCCGPARVSKAFATKDVARQAPAPVQAPAGGCPHCKKNESPAEADPSPRPEPNPTRMPEPCPCGGVEFVAVPMDRPADAKAVWVALALDSAEFESFCSPVLSLAVASVPGLRELPLLTAQDRLFAHHVLRC